LRTASGPGWLGAVIMRRQTDFGWQDARRSPLRWIVFCSALVLTVAYLRVGKVHDPVVALAPPPAIELPTRKPALEPIPLERVDILNPTPERHKSASPVSNQPEDGRANPTYNDLRRELLAE
jgi:hypothetical protein